MNSYGCQCLLRICTTIRSNLFSMQELKLQLEGQFDLIPAVGRHGICWLVHKERHKKPQVIFFNNFLLVKMECCSVLFYVLLCFAVLRSVQGRRSDDGPVKYTGVSVPVSHRKNHILSFCFLIAGINQGQTVIA